MTDCLKNTSSVALTSDAGALRADVRLADPSLEVRSDGVAVKVSADPANQLSRGADGGLYVAQTTTKTASSSGLGPYSVGVNRYIKSSLFPTGWRYYSGNEGLLYANGSATGANPLANSIEPAWTHVFANPAGDWMQVMVNVGNWGTMELVQAKGSFWTLVWQVRINNDPWFTYGEIGINNTGPYTFGVGSYTAWRYPSPQHAFIYAVPPRSDLRVSSRILLVRYAPLTSDPGGYQRIALGRTHIECFGAVA